MDLRELKALELAARSKIIFHLGYWIVPSQSSGGTYRVSIGADPSCTCDDFTLRKSEHKVVLCKHIIASRLVAARDGGASAPPMVVDAVPKKPTFKQNWPLYDRAQMTEKNRFLELLSELVQGVQEPEKTKPGRRRHLLRDMVFASAFKVFSTFSSRRFACDLADAHQKGYITKLMHSVQVCDFIDNPDMTPVLVALIQRSALPLRSVESKFAPDSTGFSTSRFIRWHDEKYGRERSGHAWVKAHVMTGTLTNIVTAVVIDTPTAADAPQFKELVEATVGAGFKVNDLCADKGYLSRENLELAEQHGAAPFIPFKSNSVAGEAGSTWERLFLYYQFRREEFLKRYHARSNVESTIAMIKAKFRDHVRAKSDVAMKNEVLLKILCHNVVVVHQSVIELGIEAEFWKDEPPLNEGGPSVLPFRTIA
ncbi:MAG TPA: transposase [Gemmataceae bacterium]|nr:transposase [Gemmataceae bacterium]